MKTIEELADKKWYDEKIGFFCPKCRSIDVGSIYIIEGAPEDVHKCILMFCNSCAHKEKFCDKKIKNRKNFAIKKVKMHI